MAAPCQTGMLVKRRHSIPARVRRVHREGISEGRAFRCEIVTASRESALPPAATSAASSSNGASSVPRPSANTGLEDVWLAIVAVSAAACAATSRAGCAACDKQYKRVLEHLSRYGTR